MGGGSALYKRAVFRGVHAGTSLVVQWIRLRLPMQGTQLRSLVQEDPTCHRATKPMNHKA